MRKAVVMSMIALFCLTSIVYAEKPQSVKYNHEVKKEAGAESRAYKTELKKESARSEKRGHGEFKKEKRSKDKKLKGIEKQRTKKAYQEQKELDRGSEKGREARQNRRKWWKFWE